MKKTKPATAGEKIELRIARLGIGPRTMTIEEFRTRSLLCVGREAAAAHDRAIARAVRKERERCMGLIANARDATPYSALSKVTISRVLCSIEEGEQP